MLLTRVTKTGYRQIMEREVLPAGCLLWGRLSYAIVTRNSVFPADNNQRNGFPNHEASSLDRDALCVDRAGWM